MTLWMDAFAILLMVGGVGILALLVGRDGIKPNDDAFDDDDSRPSMSPAVLLRNDPATSSLMYEHGDDPSDPNHL